MVSPPADAYGETRQRLAGIIIGAGRPKARIQYSPNDCASSGLFAIYSRGGTGKEHMRCQCKL
jgi:hypothetical protein